MEMDFWRDIKQLRVVSFFFIMDHVCLTYIIACIGRPTFIEVAIYAIDIAGPSDVMHDPIS